MCFEDRQTIPFLRGEDREPPRRSPSIFRAVYRGLPRTSALIGAEHRRVIGIEHVTRPPQAVLIVSGASRLLGTRKSTIRYRYNVALQSILRGT